MRCQNDRPQVKRSATSRQNSKNHRVSFVPPLDHRNHHRCAWEPNAFKWGFVSFNTSGLSDSSNGDSTTWTLVSKKGWRNTLCQEPGTDHAVGQTFDYAGIEWRRGVYQSFLWASIAWTFEEKTKRREPMISVGVIKEKLENFKFRNFETNKEKC